MSRRAAPLVLASLLALGAPSVGLTADDAELAKKTQNPIADLASLPLQLNYDHDMGPRDDGRKYTLNVQPVIPFSPNPEWNLISRTIVPIVSQEDLLPGGVADESGVGDVTQSLFFSPKKATAGGWVWGAGPVFLVPTASDDALGSGKYGIGPTVVALKQDSGWTYGMLANHLWSVFGDDDREDISATFLQPFLAYTTRTFTTFAINTEASYDWKAEEWSVPLHFMVTQMLRVGQQPLTVQAGLRYWADSPPNGPDGWGLRLAVTFLFPR